MPMLLVSLRVGQPRTLLPEPGTKERPLTTAYIKEAVENSTWLSETGLEGDTQVDKRYHGGPEQALLAYSADNYLLWRQEINLPGLWYGGFGENLTVNGQDETTVCIGDIYRIGEVLVQVSQPRGPCNTIARRWQKPELLKLVRDSGRTGWYLRVLRPGPVEVGLELQLIIRPFPEWPVAKAAEIVQHRRRNPAETRDLAACPLLTRSVRDKLLSNTTK